MSRQCSRSGCAQPAVATLSFQYSRSTAWLDELTVEREPHCYDLCEQHASRLTAPSGWRLEDRRMRVVAGGVPGTDDGAGPASIDEADASVGGPLFGAGNRLAG